MAVYSLINGDILESRTVCQLGDQIGINVMHWQVRGVTGTVDLQDAADALDAVTAPAYKPCLATSVTYYGTGLRAVSPVLSVEVASKLNTGPGTSGALVLPKQVSGLITWLTNTPGRTGRGRSYIPFPSQDDESGTEVPNAAYVTNLNIITAVIGNTTIAVIPAGGSASLRQIIWSRAHPVVKDVQEGVGRARWATQRRRGDYGRINTVPF